MSGFKVVASGQPPLASDVNQYAQALQGTVDVGGAISPCPAQGATANITMGTASVSGNLNGAYYHRVVLVTGFQQSDGSYFVVGFSPSNMTFGPFSYVNKQVTLIGISTGGAGCIGRAIYRTAANGAPGTEQFCGIIWDNSTTSYTDNLADIAGKNFINPVIGTITINGVTCSIAVDGTITLNGTASQYTNLEIAPYLRSKAQNTSPLFSMQNGLKYTLSRTFVSGSASPLPTAWVYDTNGIASPANLITTLGTITAGTAGGTGQSTSLDVGFFEIDFAAGASFSNYVFRLQFEQSLSATDWAQYAGIGAGMPTAPTCYGTAIPAAVPTTNTTGTTFALAKGNPGNLVGLDANKNIVDIGIFNQWFAGPACSPYTDGNKIDADINTTTDAVAVSINIADGTPVAWKYNSPVGTGMAVGTTLYAKNVDATHIRFCVDLAHVASNSYIDITAVGTGTRMLLVLDRITTITDISAQIQKGWKIMFTCGTARENAIYAVSGTTIRLFNMYQSAQDDMVCKNDGTAITGVYFSASDSPLGYPKYFKFPVWTMTGFTTPPANILLYCFPGANGFRVFLNYDAGNVIMATSNAATFTIVGLPAIPALPHVTAAYSKFWALAVDSGSYIYGDVRIDDGSNVLTVDKVAASAGFTTSGSKGLSEFDITYPY